jgi:hypothetical protein
MDVGTAEELSQVWQKCQSTTRISARDNQAGDRSELYFVDDEANHDKLVGLAD